MKRIYIKVRESTYRLSKHEDQSRYQDLPYFKFHHEKFQLLRDDDLPGLTYTTVLVLSAYFKGFDFLSISHFLKKYKEFFDFGIEVLSQKYLVVVFHLSRHWQKVVSKP